MILFKIYFIKLIQIKINIKIIINFFLSCKFNNIFIVNRYLVFIWTFLLNNNLGFSESCVSAVNLID